MLTVLLIMLVIVSYNVNLNPGPWNLQPREATGRRNKNLRISTRNACSKQVIGTSRNLDLVAITVMWLNDSINDYEMLEQNDFTCTEFI